MYIILNKLGEQIVNRTKNLFKCIIFGAFGNGIILNLDEILIIK